MGYIDFKIQRIRKYNRSNERCQRMRKLLDRKSAPDPTQQPTDASFLHNHTDASSSNSSTSHNQNGRGAVYMNTELYEAAKGGDVEDFIAALERVSAEESLALDTIFDQVSVWKENTYLHVAAMYENDELVGLILQHFSRKLMYRKNVDGDTALHLATKAGSVSIVDLIIRANFHSRLTMAINEKGNTPLYEALINNHQEVGEIILRWDVLSSYCVNKEGRSGLYMYVEAGNVKNVRTILSYRGRWNLCGHNFMEEQLMKGKSLIHAAILRKNIVMLKEIIAKGMHMLLHVKDENGQTVIEFAASIGFYEGEKYLLDELNKDSTEIDTFDVNQKVLQNSPFVPTSSVVGKHDRMRKLHDTFSIQPLPQEDMCHHCMDIDLYEAAKKGDVDGFITALEKFSQQRNSSLLPIFNQLSPLRSTFLHVAVSSGNKDLSMFILHYFPQLLNRTDNRGDTALHLAVRARCLDLVEILVRLRMDQLQKEALVDIDLESMDTRLKALMQTVVENEEGQTPLQEALLFKKKQIAECMIKENPEAAYYINKKGMSASYIAVLDGDIDCMKTIMSTTSCFVDQNVLHDQHSKEKSLILAAIWSEKIEMLQELARGRPVLFNLKAEHAQKLVHFAECLGFHEGANYLCNEFKLEIILESIVVEVTPELAQHAYSLDVFSLSVIGMVDLKIESIRQSMHQKGSHRRMIKLISTNSMQHFAQYNLGHPSMDLKLYEAAKKGNVPGFIGTLEKISEENKLPINIISNQLTSQGNTFLHVAANFGHEDLTGFIVYYFRKLLTQSNKKGDSALHLAARAGHLGVVDILVRFSNFHQKIRSLMDTDALRDDGQTVKRRWPVMNRLRNTPLHEAFIYNRGEVIEYLIKANVEEAYTVNNEGKSGLYLAVEAVNVDCVKTILNATSSDIVENVRGELTKGKSIINAAIRGKNIVMLREIARTMPELIHMKDPDEYNPLYYAISTGFLEGVNFLLDEFSICTSKTYSNGFFPVHLASKSGHVHVLQKLLQHCPDAEQFVNRKGQNILHVAAKYGKENAIRFILKTPELELLINEKDNDGNTPLHLATINWHPKVVSSLSWDRQVNLKLVNDAGFTALDVAEEYMETMSSYRQRLTWSALISAGCPRERSQNAPNNDNVGEKGTSRKNESYMGNYKDRVNILLLVATLIATVTYAAGFTMPGGYNNSAPHQGMATMLSKQMFQVFVICDTIAMYSAIMVAVTLIWAQLGDLTLVLNTLKLALPLLGLSLTMMSAAFMFGVCLVVSDLVWLVHCILITGIILIASLLALFIPLCFSYTLNSRVFRYISYYLFRLLILASGSYD